MNTLQLKPMSGYRREDLLDEESDLATSTTTNNNTRSRSSGGGGGGGGGGIDLIANLTSISNPNFCSQQMILTNDDDDDDDGGVGGKHHHHNESDQMHEVELNQSGCSSGISPTQQHENYAISFITTNSTYERNRVQWNRLSQFEKMLCVVIILLGAVIFTLAIILFNQPSSQVLQVHLTNKQQIQQQQQQQPNRSLCLTPKCISISSSIIDSLDMSVDACADFYEYSCGGWVKKNPLPDGHASWGTFSKLTQDNQLILKNVLEDSKRKFSGAELKAKLYYDSCMDRNGTVERLKSKPLQEFIDLIGGWNISGGFDVRAWSLQSKLTLMHNKYNRGGLFEWSVAADEKNSVRNVLDLQQGSLVMPRDYYINKTDEDKIVIAYVDFMTKIGVLLGGNELQTRAQMKEVFQLERKIAKILIPPEQMRDEEKTYHKMTLEELFKLSPFLDWVAYFREAFSPIRRNITEKEPIIVYSPEYIGNLSQLIDEYLKDDYKKTVLVNTVVWSVVQPMVTYLSKPFRDAAKAFSQVLIGSEGSTSQWRYCISDTGNVLGFALGSMFVRNAFRGESKQESKLMVKQIKQSFKEHLRQLSWMDKQTLQLAMEKADSITDMIGFPDFILNEKKLNKRYEGLVIKEDQYFKNSISSNIFMLNEFVKKLDKPANKSEWDMSPPVVNAYYAPTKNQIAFPAGILQAPFYDINRPKALNFGAMGVVMGHELTHAFDDQGREYDKKGNLREWWQKQTVEKFKEKMKCFQDQYSKYQIGADHVNGEQTLGENVADNGGLTAAFQAFTKWTKQNEEKLILPGLNYTQEQMFFIGFAQVWCSVNTAESLKLQVRNDPHTPSRYRVMGTLSNSIEFAKAFNCSVGTPMNPAEKCVVW